METLVFPRKELVAATEAILMKSRRFSHDFLEVCTFTTDW
jgi:hypothetical protein